jgi:hypothetical protein
MKHKPDCICVDCEQRQIQDGLVALLEGKNKRLAIIAALSVAATTAHMIGMPKMDLQKMLMRMYDRRIAEAAAEPEDVKPPSRPNHTRDAT